MKESPLRAPTIAAYGAPGLVLAALALTFYVFLPKYYADVVGINLTVLGVVVLLSRVWDAVIDPAIGALSDRTVSRWGRRRPWMAGGAVPLALTFVLLVVIPHIESVWLEGLYLGALTFVFFFFWTTVTVPYEALGAELSFDYDERTRLLGAREAAVLAGTLLAAVIPIVVGIGGDLSRHLPSERQRYLLLGGIYALLTVALVGICVVNVPERRWAESQRPRGFLRSIGSIFRNQPFRTLLSAYAVSALGVSVAATTILFYTEYVLGSAGGPVFLAMYLGIGTLTVPGWIYVARRLDKRRAWLSALGVNTGAFVWAMLLGWGDAKWFAVIVLLSALGLGGVMGLPPSMQADVIDYDEWTSGRRREGEYIGFWSIVKKLAAAASAGLAFPILDISGYVPGVEQQAPGAVWALRLLYVGTPSVCNLIAMVVAWRYPISRGLHEKIRRDIEARLAAAQPLPTTS